MNHYDVAVIGAGPAGFAAAMRAWDYGKNVLLVEKARMGGAGVHDGALSSKTMWELSKDYRAATRRDRGFVADRVQVSFDQVKSCVETAVREKEGQLERQLRALSTPIPGHAGRVTTLRGAARFVDAHTLRVTGTDPGDDHLVTASNVVIATGSRPRTLPGIDIDGEVVLSSDHIGTLRSFPRSLVIVGAGVIGCEFATIFSNYGQTKVYVIDRAERILPFEDADVAQLCATNLEAKGVTLHRSAKLLDLKVVDGHVRYTIEHATGGRETIDVEKALVAIGRAPNIVDLGLEAAGVALDAKGQIQSTDTVTSVPHIHAVGDATLDIALVNVGEIEGRYAVDRMFGAATCALSYENISTIMFLDPEVASVGLNELQAQAAKVPYRVAVYGYGLVNRCIAMRATSGFIKLLVTDDDELRVLGMRALGAHASTAIEAVSLMVCHRRSVRDLAELLHPHPAVTEALQDCVRMLLGTSIHKPHVFQSELRLSRVGYS
jgi:dihydrolipoamide dehydrogenase